MISTETGELAEAWFIDTPEKGKAFAASARGTAARKLRRFITAEWYLAKDRECNSSGASMLYVAPLALRSGLRQEGNVWRLHTQALFLSARKRASETTWAK